MRPLLLTALWAPVAAALDTPQSPVILVDYWTGFDPVSETYDGTHPNEAGERKISSRWLATLDGVLDPDGLIFRNGFETGDLTAWGPAVD